MEYVDLSIGIPAIVGEPSIVNGSGSTFTPNTKPIYKTSTFATENITNFFVELELGTMALYFFNSTIQPASEQLIQITVWTLFGREWKRFFVSLENEASNKYIINIGANSEGSNSLNEVAVLAGSLTRTPSIGSKTYFTVEPQLATTVVNDVDDFDWINGSTAMDATNLAGHVEVKLANAYLVVNEHPYN